MTPQERQRDHELNRALSAARTLQERLEMLGDRDADVVVIRSLRDSLARDVALNDPSLLAKRPEIVQ